MQVSETRDLSLTIRYASGEKTWAYLLLWQLWQILGYFLVPMKVTLKKSIVWDIGWTLKKGTFSFYPWCIQSESELSLVIHGQQSKVRTFSILNLHPFLPIFFLIFLITWYYRGCVGGGHLFTFFSNMCPKLQKIRKTHEKSLN